MLVVEVSSLVLVMPWVDETEKFTDVASVRSVTTAIGRMSIKGIVIHTARTAIGLRLPFLCSILIS